MKLLVKQNTCSFSSHKPTKKKDRAFCHKSNIYSQLESETQYSPGDRIFLLRPFLHTKKDWFFTLIKVSLSLSVSESTKKNVNSDSICFTFSFRFTEQKTQQYITRNGSLTHCLHASRLLNRFRNFTPSWGFPNWQDWVGVERSVWLDIYRLCWISFYHFTLNPGFISFSVKILYNFFWPRNYVHTWR